MKSTLVQDQVGHDATCVANEINLCIDAPREESILGFGEQRIRSLAGGCQRQLVRNNRDGQVNAWPQFVRADELSQTSTGTAISRRSATVSLTRCALVSRPPWCDTK